MAINKVIDRNNNILVDLSLDTISPSKVIKGTKFHGADGEEYEGTLTLTNKNNTRNPALYSFFDYDGTLLYEYTDEQLDALTELPAAPSHSNRKLKFDSWNWTLEDLKSADRNRPDRPIVGANYSTTDGNIYIDLRVAIKDNNSIKFTLGRCDLHSGNALPATENKIVVDWGDGNIEEFADTGTKVEPTHTYSETGAYIVCITPQSTVGFSIASQKISNFTGILYDDFRFASTIQFISLFSLNISSPTTDISFSDFYGDIIGFKAVSIPGSCKFFRAASINSAFIRLFDFVVLPNGSGVTVRRYPDSSYMSSYVIYSLSSKIVSFPKELFIPERYSNYEVIYAIALDDAYIPLNMFNSWAIQQSSIFNAELEYVKLNLIEGYCSSTSVSYSPARYKVGTLDLSDSTVTKLYKLCYPSRMDKVIFPESLTELDLSLASYCREIIVPAGVTALKGYVNTGGPTTLDLSRTEFIPITSSIGLSTDVKYRHQILVPEGLLDQYKSASYWSSYASIMVGV